jgi:23S rRNA (cytidine1920-2'-O)/16S rRNA (cytidine1409-2'-O)-methyltransferase
MQGKVTVNDRVITKAGTLVAETAVITCDIQEPRFVCRAGFKLEKALQHFNIDVTNKVVLDAGLSTGGFTDCLLQCGAQKVYGVDVGYGQVHDRIRHDSRVIVLERTNLRHLTSLPEKVDLVTLDLSFISVLKVMPAIMQLIKPHAELVVLIKPQFEAERTDVMKGGIIKDPKTHTRVIEKVTAAIKEYSFTCHGVIDSPLLGTSGNKEFLAYFTK